MTSKSRTAHRGDGFELLIDEMESLSAEYGDAVTEAIELATKSPLPEKEARALFERILTILRTSGRDLSNQEHRQMADEIRREVDALIDAGPTRDSDQLIGHGGLTFHAKNGLSPRSVVPVPTFNGVAIPMTEGFVDVKSLRLWKDNHRVQLHVQEFRDINHRDPEDYELMLLLQGLLHLPGQDKKDPFQLRDLANSIARKGVERPPILTWDGEPKDGNRRIAASRFVLDSSDFTRGAKERARWIRVWQAPEGTTEDQFEAIVVALNFEDDHKIEWPEYVKARLVEDEYRTRRSMLRGKFTSKNALELRKEVALQFAIGQDEVRRYLEMVHWADDFEAYHEDERALDPAAVRYKANDIFQWFYEIQAGRGKDKLIHKIDQDDDLKAIVYDLMYDVLDSGAQVRALHTVVADDEALDFLVQAHQENDPDQALRLVDAAVAHAKANAPTRRTGFPQFLRNAVKRLGGTPPNHWQGLETPLLRDLQRVLRSAIGAVEGELANRGELTTQGPEE